MTQKGYFFAKIKYQLFKDFFSSMSTDVIWRPFWQRTSFDVRGRHLTSVLTADIIWRPRTSFDVRFEGGRHLTTVLTADVIWRPRTSFDVHFDSRRHLTSADIIWRPFWQCASFYIHGRHSHLTSVLTADVIWRPFGQRMAVDIRGFNVCFYSGSHLTSANVIWRPFSQRTWFDICGCHLKSIYICFHTGACNMIKINKECVGLYPTDVLHYGCCVNIDLSWFK